MTDILLEVSGDLKFSGGDFAIGDADLQNQWLILTSNKGEWKENPTVGAGLENYLNDDGTDKMFSEIRKQLTMDGFDVKSISVQTNGQLGIDAEY